MKYLFLYLIVLSLVFAFTNVHALLLTTPLDLWESNQLIIDGTIISKTVISSEKLIQYDVKVNQYFKNPQKSAMITIYGPSEEDTDYMYPKYFEIGERALFYLNKIDGKYKISPYSVKTTKTCNARDFIEISPVLPNERPPISSPAGNEEYIDPCVPSYFTEDPDHVTVVTDNDKMDTDYVKYDFSNKENFALPAFIKKIPLPSDIRQSMFDWCADYPSSSKNDERFWDAVPIRIFSKTPEFQALQGDTNSFVIHSYAAQESCPPYVQMVGTFTSKDGDKHRFALSYDGDFFRYQIDETRSLEYQALAPLKQFKIGLPIDDIICKDSLLLVIKSSNGHPACVKPDTKQKLIQRGWGTHQSQYHDSIEVILKDGTKSFVTYDISNGMVNEVRPSIPDRSLVVEIEGYGDGILDITIPRGLVDAKLGDEKSAEDDSFFVLINGSEVAFKEKPPNEVFRSLSIPFSKGASEIEILGTFLNSGCC